MAIFSLQPAIFALYLAMGAAAGVVAGLFGVGGGIVIVPALVFSFTALGFPPEILTQLALGSSLAAMVFTSLSSVRAHHRLGNVRWPVFWGLAPGVVLGCWLGVNTAGRLSGGVLQLAFGLFALAVAVQMGLNAKPKPTRELPGRAGLGAVGAGIGYVSALFGIGGGTLSVPYLSWCNVRMQQAVATSAACGLPIALVGLFANVQVGWDRPQLPAWSTGFVYWPAVLGILLASAPCARYGARLAQRLPADRLRQLFAAFLLLVGLAFIHRNL